MGESVLVAIITALGALIGTWAANKKTIALIEYRLNQIEAKLDKHNHFEERIVTLEKDEALSMAELKRHGERIKILEEK